MKRTTTLPKKNTRPRKKTSQHLLTLILFAFCFIVLGLSYRYLATTPSVDTSSIPQSGETNNKNTNNKETLNPTAAATTPQRMKTVVVIGGGLAGQSAAIQAARGGAKVVLLEKEGRLGGNSAKATSGINAWGSATQKAQGIEDSAKYFERDTFLSGKGGHSQPGLVKMLSQRSAAAIEWLTSFDIPLTVLSQLGGASRKRCHRAPEKPDGTPLPIGFTIIKAMEKQLRETFAESVMIETNSQLQRLLSETITLPDGDSAVRVNGVEYVKRSKAAEGEEPRQETVQLTADAVILATGGFSNDHTANSLLQKYAPQLAAFPTTNGPWATGDGVKMAEELGVALVDMDKVQLHPTGLLNPKDPNAKTVFLGPEALRGSGGILLNKRGERFINELDLRSVVSQAILDQEDLFPGTERKFAFCILNEKAKELFGKGTLDFYWKKFGLFTFAEDVKALAELVGVEEEKLTRTLEEYENLSRSSEVCPKTGKNVFPCVLGPQGPFYVAYVTPSIHYTMGGCLISPSAEILSAGLGVFGIRKPIYGLFGAGEVTGGVHGGNRLGGNSLLECVVFGRIAGDRASRVGPFAAPALTSASTWVAATVKELLPEDSAQEQGLTEGARLVEISLPFSYATSGLAPLQTVGLRRGPHTSYLLPSSSPRQLGSLTIALPAPPAAPAWLYDLLPGDELELSLSVAPPPALLPKGELYLIASAPEGVAATLQLVQLGTEKRSPYTKVHLLYTARNHSHLSFRRLLKECEENSSGKLKCEMVLEEPPLEWSEGIGPIDADILHRFLPPVCGECNGKPEASIVVVGNPYHNQFVLNYLKEKNYDKEYTLVSL